MKLGDFFAAAPHARPVNPRAIKFTATHSGLTLPDGSANPSGRTIAATVEGAFIFLSGEQEQRARLDAHRATRARELATQPKNAPPALPLPPDAEAFGMETAYQTLWRALREWDPKERLAGEQLFPSAEVMQQMVTPMEAGRLYRAYLKYLEDEHPEGGPDQNTFRGAEGGSEGAPSQ